MYMFFLMVRLPTTSTLFPYTTLFRSRPERLVHLRVLEAGHPAGPEGGSGRLAALSRHLQGGSRVPPGARDLDRSREATRDRKSTRLNSSHPSIAYAVFCLKKKNRSQI